MGEQQSLSFPSALVPIALVSYIIEGLHQFKDTPMLNILGMGQREVAI